MNVVKNKRNLLLQILRFTLVGGSAFLVDAGLLFILKEFAGINYLISGAISFTASVIYNYVLSIKWVFDIKAHRDKTQEFIIFVLLSLIGLALNQFFMWLFVELFYIHYMISKVFATSIIMVYNFVTRKIFLEKKKR